MPGRDQSRTGRGIGPVIGAVAGAFIVAILAGVGIWRMELAERLIRHEIQTLHLPMRWQLRGVGLDGAVIGRISIGDPAHPDLAIDRAEVRVGLSGIPTITLWGLRVHGHLFHGHVSFGSLDALINTPSTTPFSLPNWDVRLIDARAVIDGDAGVARFWASGSGRLRDGFSGTLAGESPLLALSQPSGAACRASDTALAARITIAAGQPRIDGAMTSGQISCGGAVYAHPRLSLTARLAAAWDGGEARLEMGPLDGGPVRASGLALSGRWRSGPGGTLSGQGSISGTGFAPATATLASLMRGGVAARGTLVSPLLASITGTLSQAQGARLSGQWALRGNTDGLALDVPEMRLTGARGDWLRVSRLTLGPSGPSGHFTLSGGLPALEGQIGTTSIAGRKQLVVAMRAERFSAADASIAVPMAQVTRGADAALVMRAALVVSGPLPGGRVEALSLPLAARWTAEGGLQLGTACTVVRVGKLSMGGAVLREQAVSLCPSSQSLVVVRGDDTRIGARIARLAVTGAMGGEALRVTSGPMAVDWSGAGQRQLLAKGLAISLGTGEGGSHFALASVTAKFGHAGMAGDFSGANIALGAVPVDLRDATGQWRGSDGALRLENMDFRLKDRASDERFYPLVARGGTLELREGVIHAEAALREPKSDREIASLTLVHSLSSSTGRLDFTVPSLTFDKALQPEAITPLTLGVVANAAGSLSGEGQISWANGKLASHGSLSTPGLDFAVAFGPVRGVAGRVEFTDLIGMITAPDQHVRIASLNPGIEVRDGEVSFALLPGRVVVLNGVEWPFIDGRLRLLPTRMVLGASEVRRYELVIEGLNASKFLQYLDLSNIGATGIFDGHLPLVFNGSIGRIEGGQLSSRPGGGSVSYVGELSYRDMAPVANYAFRMLRSLQYSDMKIGMDGPLDGDIVTRMELKGVGQGPGASRNFLTRQIARAHGEVGEKVDGYLGVVGAPNPTLRRMVEDLNIRRKAVYSEHAQAQHATLEEYAFTSGCRLIEATVPGEKYQGPDGVWHERTAAAPLRDTRCP